jgi:hypothetical protein
VWAAYVPHTFFEVCTRVPLASLAQHTTGINILLAGPSRIRWRQGEPYTDYGAYAYSQQLANQIPVKVDGLPLNTSKITPDGVTHLIKYSASNGTTTLVYFRRM